MKKEYKFKKEITEEEIKNLKEKLIYDKVTGIFYKKLKSGALKPAGSLRLGYICISINKIAYRAHRLAWLFEYGELPNSHIDHINRIKTDNRIKNLRLVNDSENQMNSKLNSNNTSGYNGVYFDKRKNKYKSRIVFNKKKINLGSFDSPKEAYDAYCKFAEEHFPDHFHKDKTKEDPKDFFKKIINEKIYGPELEPKQIDLEELAQGKYDDEILWYYPVNKKKKPKKVKGIKNVLHNNIWHSESYLQEVDKNNIEISYKGIVKPFSKNGRVQIAVFPNRRLCIKSYKESEAVVLEYQLDNKFREINKKWFIDIKKAIEEGRNLK